MKQTSLSDTHLKYHTFSNSTFRIDKCDLGLGTFANEPFQRGEKILTFTGSYIDFKETKTRGCWECMPIQIDENQYIDTVAPGVFVNHSCAPNAGIKRDRDLVALRTISAGEEICFDYSTTMEENSFTMECRCGDPVCRGIIADFSTLPIETQEKYIKQGNVMDFIVRQNRNRAERVFKVTCGKPPLKPALMSLIRSYIKGLLPISKFRQMYRHLSSGAFHTDRRKQY